MKQKVTIARAPKEMNRIAGRLAKAREQVGKENSCDKKVQRGIDLIVKSCEKARIAAPKIYEDHGFIYTVFTRPTAQEWNDKVGKVNHEVNEVNEVNLHILQILRDNPQCTIPDLATACNVSRATVDRAHKALKDASRIRRIGGTRGHWEVCD